jgi:hypothetical protein
MYMLLCDSLFLIFIGLILFGVLKNRVVQKLQFLNKFRLKPAKCHAFCETCETANRAVEQVQYINRFWNRIINLHSCSWNPWV